ncbi:unnamed protein product, partial [Ectocarpus fasciculatus]
MCVSDGHHGCWKHGVNNDTRRSYSTRGMLLSSKLGCTEHSAFLSVRCPRPLSGPQDIHWRILPNGRPGTRQTWNLVHIIWVCWKDYDCVYGDSFAVGRGVRRSNQW